MNQNSETKGYIEAEGYVEAEAEAEAEELADFVDFLNEKGLGSVEVREFIENYKGSEQMLKLMKTSMALQYALSPDIETRTIVRFRFNDIKTAQAAAHLLRLNNGSMNYMVLIKLMYLADRQMLLDHGMPITGDRFFSMKNGPVLSTVLDFITYGPARGPRSAWFALIDDPKGYDVSLKSTLVPTNELSRYELRLLEQTYKQYGHISQWDLVDLLHKILPEWKDPDGSASRIEYVDILRVEDRKDEDLELFRSQAHSAWFLDLLG